MLATVIYRINSVYCLLPTSTIFSPTASHIYAPPCTAFAKAILYNPLSIILLFSFNSCTSFCTTDYRRKTPNSICDYSGYYISYSYTYSCITPTVRPDIVVSTIALFQLILLFVPSFKLPSPLLL